MGAATKPTTNGTAHERNGHAPASRLANVAPVNPQARGGDSEAAPLEPSATAAGEAPKPATEGRDAGGKFAIGNRFGKGNPHARRMADLRQAFLSAATEERMRELGEKLFTAALAGDWQAAKLLLPFVIGRPTDAVNPDALDIDEWKGCQEWDAIHAEWFRKLSMADALRLHKALSELGQDGIERVSGPLDEADAAR
jgi:hypothetical protein